MENCLDCTKFDVCPKSRHIENYRLRMQCSEFVPKNDELEVEEEVKNDLHKF